VYDYCFNRDNLSNTVATGDNKKRLFSSCHNLLLLIVIAAYNIKLAMTVISSYKPGNSKN